MLKILGDINLADWYFDMGCGVGTTIEAGGNPFEYLERSDKDFWIGNFECVCANIQEKNYPFVIRPKYLDKITHLNFYGVANNHLMQAGDSAYLETIKYLSSNKILFAGTSKIKSTIFSHQGKNVGILAFSQRPDNFTQNPLYWHLPEYNEIVFEIKTLSDCDYKIAFIHWGYEFMNYPNIDQKQFGHWLIDYSIDLVVGMHPHVAQGMEIYHGKPIYYSLGNSVFHMNWEPTKYGLLLTVDLDSQKVTNQHTKIDSLGFPHIVKDVPYQYSMEYLNSLISISEENEKYFSKAAKMTSLYRRANHSAILKDIIKGDSPYAKRMISDFIKRRFTHK